MFLEVRHLEETSKLLANTPHCFQSQRPVSRKMIYTKTKLKHQKEKKKGITDLKTVVKSSRNCLTLKIKFSCHYSLSNVNSPSFLFVKSKALTLKEVPRLH